LVIPQILTLVAISPPQHSMAGEFAQSRAVARRVPLGARQNSSRGRNGKGTTDEHGWKPASLIPARVHQSVSAGRAQSIQL
jgi:hypothetical protein